MRWEMFTATEHGPRNAPNLDSRQVRTIYVPVTLFFSILACPNKRFCLGS